MKKIISLVIVALVFGMAVPAMAQVNAEYSSHSGTISATGGTISVAVAVPDDGKFVQLAPLSKIIMVFPGAYVAVPDGTGAADLRIDTYNASSLADAEIFVSTDGLDWTSVGEHSDVANVDIDLDAESISMVKYVKVDQARHYLDPAHPWHGFDLDAVVALNAAIPINVDIDIKPGSFPNTINLKSKGLVPVAILTTDVFDATTVDAATVAFGPGAAPAHPGPERIEDVDGDGDLDLVFHFSIQDVGLLAGDTMATLTGQTDSGDPITGADSVKIVGG